MNILDLAKTVRPGSKIEFVGIRPGEKMHEQMIGQDDAEFTFEYGKYYKILPMIHNWHKDENRIKNGRPVPKDFYYSSKNNTNWLKPSELKDWISKNIDKMDLL